MLLRKSRKNNILKLHLKHVPFFKILMSDAHFCNLRCSNKCAIRPQVELCYFPGPTASEPKTRQLIEEHTGLCFVRELSGKDQIS